MEFPRVFFKITHPMSKPLCFVLMPFGEKKDAAGAIIQFDAVYKDLIRPAIEAAEMEPIRADEEMTGGIIHKPMFERLILCEYAIADLTTANANVFYELGVRHAVRPWSTILIFAKGSRLPFDLGPLRGLPYDVGVDGKPVAPATGINAIAAQLAAAREATTDSPIYQLVDGFPEVDHTKTDVFRDQVRYSEQAKERLATARRLGADAVRAKGKELEPIANQEAGVVIDLFLSLRAVKAWNDMIVLVEKMSKPLAATVLVQEQLGLALNRAGQGERAERVLLALLERRGPSPETYGILGRVYKDRWEAATKQGDHFEAPRLLDKAIGAYLRGFEADWRDAYPGVNAVTLMTLRNPPDARREQILPVVTYAVERKITTGKPDYWDYATRLELAVLDKNEEKAVGALGDTLASVREPWELETTANNLRLIREARDQRNTLMSFVAGLEEELMRKADALQKKLNA
jgi:MAP3K TRAFs-binding domain